MMPELTTESASSSPICDIGQADSCRAGQHFSVPWLFGLFIIWAAITPFQSWQSSLSIAVVMLTWLFGCSRTRKATGQVLWLIFIPAGLIWLKAIFFGFADQVNQEIGTALLSVDANRFFIMPFNGLIVFVTIFLTSVTVIRFFPKGTPVVVGAHVLLISYRTWLAFMHSNS
ncbi:MAG: hypothetical protein U0930_16820 [Pirellulales bacterium]